MFKPLKDFKCANQRVRVRFIVNFSTYTRHTEELKIRFSLSHRRDTQHISHYLASLNIT